MKFLDKLLGIDKKRNKALLMAAEEGDATSVEKLLKKGVDVNVVNMYGNTVLVGSASRGHANVVKALLSHGADVNSVDKYGKSVLSLATYKGHAKVVNVLLSHGADVNFVDKDGQTALMKAVINGRMGVVKVLLSHGANMNIADKEGNTVLLYATRQGHRDIVKALLAHGADVADVNEVGKDCNTALLEAIEKGHADVVELLLAHGAHRDLDAEVGQLILFKAVEQYQTDVVEALLKRGTDVNKVGNDGNTALMNAAYYGYMYIINLLLAHGADMNVRDKNGKTALSKAAEKGHVNVVKMLLAHGAGGDLDAEVGQLILFKAVEQGHTGVVEALLKRGTDVNVVGKDANTALMNASSNGHMDIIKVLLTHGADVNIIDKNGYTALLYAARQGHTAVVQMLIDQGADVNKAGQFGHTALSLAIEKGHADVAKVLSAHGADLNTADKDGVTALMSATEEDQSIVKRIFPTITNEHLHGVFGDDSSRTPGPGNRFLDESTIPWNNQDFDKASNLLHAAINAGLEGYDKASAHAQLGIIFIDTNDIHSAVFQFLECLATRNIPADWGWQAAVHLYFIYDEAGRLEEAHKLKGLMDSANKENEKHYGFPLSLEPVAETKIRLMARRYTLDIKKQEVLPSKSVKQLNNHPRHLKAKHPEPAQNKIKKFEQILSLAATLAGGWPTELPRNSFDRINIVKLLTKLREYQEMTHRGFYSKPHYEVENNKIGRGCDPNRDFQILQTASFLAGRGNVNLVIGGGGGDNAQIVFLMWEVMNRYAKTRLAKFLFFMPRIADELEEISRMRVVSDSLLIDVYKGIENIIFEIYHELPNRGSFDDEMVNEKLLSLVKMQTSERKE